MRVLFNCEVPFMLAHGGAQTQIEQTKAALEAIGVSVEPLRWYDGAQAGDILQHFGRLSVQMTRAAQAKGIKAVMLDLLTEAGSRSWPRLKLQKIAQRVLAAVLPGMVRDAFRWDSYRLADACIANTAWEAHLMKELFGAPPARVHVVPNGVEEVFFKTPPFERGQWLVCTSTIIERKRIVELAEAAVLAQTPIWIIGKPYSDGAPYAKRFFELAKEHPRTIRYEGASSDRTKLAQIYREARGFVLLSTAETLSLSAGEAAASACPLLLSDLPWARTAYGPGATYCPIASAARTAKVLKQFYDEAPKLPPPPRPPTWRQVAEQLRMLYGSLRHSDR